MKRRTDGYTLLKLYGSYSFNGGGAVHTITARLDNATNELYRNHLSLIKDFAPEMGRNFKSGVRRDVLMRVYRTARRAADVVAGLLLLRTRRLSLHQGSARFRQRERQRLLSAFA